MDNEATVMRQRIDETMASLTDKLGELEHRISGTVRTVTDSVDTVRDTFDLRLHVRRRPWSVLAGAAALGFLWGSLSCNYGARHPARNGRSASTPPARLAVAKHPPAGANNGANGADEARLPAAAAPSWLANLGGTLQPEIAALRGIAVGALFEVVREIVTKQAARPMAPSVGNANNGSKGKLENRERTSR